MKRQRLSLKIIVGIVIFVVYVLIMNFSKSIATYSIGTTTADNDNANKTQYTMTLNKEELLTGAIIGPENDTAAKRDPIINYAYGVWYRNYAGLTDFDSETNHVKVPSKKYVLFMKQKLKNNGENLYDISYSAKRKKLSDKSGGAGFAHGQWNWGAELGYLSFYNESSNPFNLSYMMSFYESTNPISGYTNVQYAIWNKFNEDAAYADNGLNSANDAYSSYYNEKTETNEQIDITANESLSVSNGEEYTKVGPFSINNYLYYQDSHGNVEKYSGKNLENYQNLLGGIVSITVTLKNNSNAVQTYMIGDCDRKVYIDCSILKNDLYPNSNSSFYIMIKNSEINSGYYNLDKIICKYRKTDAYGYGGTYEYFDKMKEDDSGTTNNDWSQLIFPLGKEDSANRNYSPYVEVTDTDYSTPLNITLLQANVSINNYIYKVNGSKILEYSKDENLDVLGNSRGNDKNISELWKKEHPVVLEAGDTIEYIVELKNEGTHTYVRLEDIIPDTLENVSMVLYTEKFELSTNNDGALGSEKSHTSTKISENDWPDREDSYTTESDDNHHSGYQITKNGKKYIYVMGNSGLAYKITGTVKKDDGSTKVSKATITETYLCITNTGDDDYELGIKLKNASSKQSSSDYFICKQYNVGVYTYISKVSRNDGSNVVDGEVLADNKDYVPLKNGGDRSINKLKNNEQDAKNNPVYVENGDLLTYIIRVSNNSYKESPCYNPNNVTASVKIDLPEGAIIVDKTKSKNITWNDKTNEFSVNLAYYITSGVEITILTNSNESTAYGFTDPAREIKATVSNVTNINGKQTNNNEIVNIVSDTMPKETYDMIIQGNPANGTYSGYSLTKSSSDYYQIKEYNVAIDTYISNVIHNQSIGTKATYNSSSERKSSIDVATGKSNQDDEKDKNPVYVEYGDEVTYNVTIYNTTDNNRYNCGRSNDPYKQPQYVTLDLTDILPEKYSNLYVIDETINIAKDSDRVVKDGNNVKIKDITVGAGSEKTLQVIFVVEDVEKDKVLENKVQIDNDSIRNINGYRVVNNSKRTSSSDKYKLNSYSVTIDEYISQYNAEMAKYNNAHEFTEGESEGFSDSTTNYTNTSPLNAEKNETLTISTKVTNTANGGEDENNVDSSGKYNTRVRPTDLTQTLANGLNWKGTSAVWHKADGTEQDITSNIEVTSEEVGNTKVYQYKLKSNKIILSPGEYIIYNTTVEITESNEYLGLLESVSQIVTLTNVNRSSTNDRIVTAQNTETKTSDNDYVRLKDLIIAGSVWLDENRDGYKNETESGKKDVEVKLYKSNGEKVAEAKTNENGFYNFGRQWKSSTKDKNNNYTSTDYINYYIDFEYDGTVFKSTEVYGGVNDGKADGTGNLSNTWRQGYSDLPGKTSGKTEYLTDSNAYEFANERNSFNNKYRTIGYNRSYHGTTPEVSLSYDKTNHISVFKEDTSIADRIITARSFVKQDYSSEEIAKDLSNTKTLPLYSYEGYSNTNPETEYMKYINLGLVLREKVDVSLDSDVVSVETAINGEQLTYEFAENTADSSSDDYTSSPNAYKLDKPYKLKLDSADYNYRYDEYYDDDDLKEYKGIENELEVKVNYRITLRNKAITNDEPGMANPDIPIETAINEVAIYYDANFVKDANTQTTVKQKNAETGIFENLVRDSIIVSYNGQNIKSKISSTSKYGNNIPSDLAEKGYNALYLTDLGNVYIQEGESKDIDISFFVDKDTARALKIVDNKENNMGLELISEITAYSTSYSGSYERKILAGKNAGLIDCDSNPGNIGLNSIEDYNKYEDDTYKVGIKIMLKDDPDDEEEPPGGPKDKTSRKITGFVWEDNSNDKNTEQYIVDGQYTSNEEKVAGVKVTLMEISQKGTGIYYEKPAKYTYDVKDESGNIIHYKGTEISTVTDASGNYILDSFIPGYYVVRFDYGYNQDDDNSIRFNGQDYKSTTYYCGYNDPNGYGYYTNKRGYKSNNIGSKNNFNYFDFVKNSLIMENLSDAQDDEIRRLNVNSYSETMTTEQAQVFAAPKTHRDALTKNTWMYSESTIFYVKPENVKSAVTTVNNEDIKDTSWKLDNLDFGLVYRPQASIILDKEIDNLEIITSDNKTLVKLYFKEQSGTRVIDEEKSVGYENIQFLPNYKKTTQGFVYINMDTDILQGTTMKVHYTIDATNNSEVDRVNTNLDEIKYKIGAINKNYTDFGVDVDGNYSANGTAANALSSVYYNGYVFNSSEGKESFNYLTRLKKPYTISNKLKIGNIELKGTGYYGMYLGEAYYTGSIGANDVETKLKVDNILDYIDNDFTFSTSENNIKNNTWSTKTSLDLEKVLNWNKVNSIQDSGKKYLVDKKEIRYDTDNRSNLALTVDTNRDGTNETTGNTSLSRFLSTKKITNKGKTETTGTIGITVSKVFSAEDLTNGDGLNFENIAEVVQYTSLTGRRTIVPDGNKGGIIGNANVSTNWTGYNKFEDDTDATELITITPPTGLTK